MHDALEKLAESWREEAARCRSRDPLTFYAMTDCADELTAVLERFPKPVSGTPAKSLQDNTITTPDTGGPHA